MPFLQISRHLSAEMEAIHTFTLTLTELLKNMKGSGRNSFGKRVWLSGNVKTWFRFWTNRARPRRTGPFEKNGRAVELRIERYVTKVLSHDLVSCTYSQLTNCPGSSAWLAQQRPVERCRWCKADVQTPKPESKSHHSVSIALGLQKNAVDIGRRSKNAFCSVAWLTNSAIGSAYR